MPCILCVAVLGVAAAVVAPALVENLDETLRSAAADLRRVRESSSVVLWTGTFSFVAVDGQVRAAAANVTVYKQAKRARIQVRTHALAHEDVHRLQDRVADLLGATIVSRRDGALAEEARMEAHMAAEQEAAGLPPPMPQLSSEAGPGTLPPLGN